jgi:hypothetical protein
MEHSDEEHTARHERSPRKTAQKSWRRVENLDEANTDGCINEGK